MIRKHPLLWGGLIVLLAVLNLWRWLPALHRGPGSADAFLPAGLALEFPSDAVRVEGPVRDLFAFGAAPAARRRKAPAAPAPAPVVRAAPVPTAPDGSVTEAAGGYRLLGVVYRDGKSQALIGKGDQLFPVVRGDEIEGRYQVDSIDENEVYLTEKQTGNTLRLHIWDSQGATP